MSGSQSENEAVLQALDFATPSEQDLVPVDQSGFPYGPAAGAAFNRIAHTVLDVLDVRGGMQSNHLEVVTDGGSLAIPSVFPGGCPIQFEHSAGVSSLERLAGRTTDSYAVVEMLSVNLPEPQGRVVLMSNRHGDRWVHFAGEFEASWDASKPEDAPEELREVALEAELLTYAHLRYMGTGPVEGCRIQIADILIRQALEHAYDAMTSVGIDDDSPGIKVILGQTHFRTYLIMHLSTLLDVLPQHDMPANALRRLYEEVLEAADAGRVARVLTPATLLVLEQAVRALDGVTWDAVDAVALSDVASSPVPHAQWWAGHGLALQLNRVIAELEVLQGSIRAEGQTLAGALLEEVSLLAGTATASTQPAVSS